MYIDNSYFIGQLEIPNAKDYPGATKDGNVIRLQQFVSDYEVEVMIYGLGNPLFTEFNNIFEINGDLKVGTLQKWVDFVDGKQYVIDGETYLWKGLRYTDGAIKKSLIADYVYYKFLTEYSVNFGGVGMQTEEANNSSRQSAIPQLAIIWNNFILKYQGNKIDNNGLIPTVRESAYGTSIGIDWSQDRDEYFVNMHQYLTDHEADFPTLNTYFFGKKNSIGL